MRRMQGCPQRMRLQRRQFLFQISGFEIETQLILFPTDDLMILIFLSKKVQIKLLNYIILTTLGRH